MKILKSKKMKLKKLQIVKILLSFVIIIFCSQNSSMAKYYEMLNKVFVRTAIAEPIVVVEKMQDTVVSEMNKKSQNKEYYFKIKNYKIENSQKRITEIDFDCYIEVKNSNIYFPIKYELYDCQSEEMILESQTMSKKIHIDKITEFEKDYKLVVSWDNKEIIQGNLDDIEIEIHIVQANTLERNVK